MMRSLISPSIAVSYTHLSRAALAESGPWAAFAFGRILQSFQLLLQRFPCRPQISLPGHVDVYKRQTSYGLLILSGTICSISQDLSTAFPNMDSVF